MVSASDYGLSPDSDWLDADTLIALHEFRQQLIWDLSEQSIRRNELLPTTSLYETVERELDLEEEVFVRLVFAGMMLAQDRLLRSETPEQRQEREAQEERFMGFLDELTSDFGGLTGFIEKCRDEVSERNAEIEGLNRLFGESD